jgi:peptidoglycan/LPS O-acetylase OafA/YrhL
VSQDSRADGEPRPSVGPRYAFVDSLRGLAACAVMLYHYSGGDLRAPLARVLSDPVVAALRGGWLGVQVFFVLSGFVIAKTVGDRAMTPTGAVRFALRRQVRLDPPYWASIALACASAWAFGVSRHQPYTLPSLGSVAAHLVYLQEFLGVRAIQSVYWTLAIEVQFYLVLVMSLALLQPVRRHAVWVVLASALGSLAQSMNWRFVHGWFIPHWYLFALGALAWWTQRRRASLGAFVALVVWCAYEGHVHDRSEPVAGALVAATLALAARGEGLERWLAWRPLTFLGTISYGIYLLHTIVGAHVRGLIGGVVHSRTPTGALIVTALASAVTVGCAWGLYRAVERPAMRLAARIRWSDRGA